MPKRTPQQPSLLESASMAGVGEGMGASEGGPAKRHRAREPPANEEETTVAKLRLPRRGEENEEDEEENLLAHDDEQEEENLETMPPELRLILGFHRSGSARNEDAVREMLVRTALDLGSAVALAEETLLKIETFCISLFDTARYAYAPSATLLRACILYLASFAKHRFEDRTIVLDDVSSLLASASSPNPSDASTTTTTTTPSSSLTPTLISVEPIASPSSPSSAAVTTGGDAIHIRPVTLLVLSLIQASHPHEAAVMQYLIHRLLTKCLDSTTSLASSAVASQRLAHLTEDLLKLVDVPETPSAFPLLLAISNALCHLLLPNNTEEPPAPPIPAVFAAIALEIVGNVCAWRAALDSLTPKEQRMTPKKRRKQTPDDDNAEEEEEQGEIACPCGEGFEGKFMIECVACKKWYHGGCVGVDDMGPALNHLRWSCDDCLILEEASNRIAVPVVTQGGENVTEEAQSDPINKPPTKSRRKSGRKANNNNVSSKSPAEAPPPPTKEELEEAANKIKDEVRTELIRNYLLDRLSVAKDRLVEFALESYVRRKDDEDPRLDSSSRSKFKTFLSRRSTSRLVSQERIKDKAALGITVVHVLCRVASHSPSPSQRSKALKALATAVDASKGALLAEASVRAMIENRLRDSAVSVRETALEIVGRYVRADYHAVLLRALADPGISVRKRAVRILKDGFLGNGVAVTETEPRADSPDSIAVASSSTSAEKKKRKEDIARETCVHLADRLRDSKEEETVKELVIRSLSDFWFSSSSSSTTSSSSSAVSLIAFVNAVPRPEDVFPSLISTASSSAITALVDAVVGHLVSSSRNLPEAEKCLKTLRMFALCDPSYLPARHFSALTFHLATPSAPPALVVETVLTCKAVLPTLDFAKPPAAQNGGEISASDENAEDLGSRLTRQLENLLYTQPPNGLAAVASCLCALSQRIGSFSGVERASKKFFAYLVSLRGSLALPENTSNLQRCLYALALLVRYSSMTEEIVAAATTLIVPYANAENHHKSGGNSTVRKRAIQSLALFLHKTKRETQAEVVECWVKTLASSLVTTPSDVKAQILASLTDILAVVSSSTSAAEDHKEERGTSPSGVGDVCGGNEFLMGLIQGHFLTFLKSYEGEKEEDEKVRFAALSLLRGLLSRGLIHPNQVSVSLLRRACSDVSALVREASLAAASEIHTRSPILVHHVVRAAEEACFAPSFRQEDEEDDSSREFGTRIGRIYATFVGQGDRAGRLKFLEALVAFAMTGATGGGSGGTTNRLARVSEPDDVCLVTERACETLHSLPYTSYDEVVCVLKRARNLSSLRAAELRSKLDGLLGPVLRAQKKGELVTESIAPGLGESETKECRDALRTACVMRLIASLTQGYKVSASRLASSSSSPLETSVTGSTSASSTSHLLPPGSAPLGRLDFKMREKAATLARESDLLAVRCASALAELIRAMKDDTGPTVVDPLASAATKRGNTSAVASAKRGRKAATSTGGRRRRRRRLEEEDDDEEEEEEDDDDDDESDAKEEENVGAEHSSKFQFTTPVDTVRRGTRIRKQRVMLDFDAGQALDDDEEE